MATGPLDGLGLNWGTRMLELLHPDGVVRAVRVFGDNCPRDALPCLSPGEAPATADLVVIAPNRGQARSVAWLRRAAAAAADAVAREGVLFVAAPPLARRALVTMLSARGLVCDRAYLQHPGWPNGHVLAPVSHRALSYAYTHLIPTRRRRRNLVLAALRLRPALALLRVLAPGTVIMMQRPGAAPAGRWFFALTGHPPDGGDLIINASWRGAEGAVVLIRFRGGGRLPNAVGKTVLTGTLAEIYDGEASKLQTIAPGAAVAGMATPMLLARGRRGDHPVLVESLLPGGPARPLLEKGVLGPQPLVSRLAAWLQEWHRATLQPATMNPDLCARSWLQPATALASSLVDGPRYVAWLSAQCDRILGRRIPLVAVHNDLTMMNVMAPDPGLGERLGIIDWEAAVASGLPLTDFFYAATDAVMYATDPLDRAAAFDACFLPGGPHAAWIAALRDRLISALSLDRDVAELCFHACWLYHAAVEARASSAAPRPFLAVLERAARLALNNADPRSFAVEPAPGGAAPRRTAAT